MTSARADAATPIVAVIIAIPAAMIAVTFTVVSDL
jgi:hypothetical protein